MSLAPREWFSPRERTDGIGVLIGIRERKTGHCPSEVQSLNPDLNCDDRDRIGKGQCYPPVLVGPKW